MRLVCLPNFFLSTHCILQVSIAYQLDIFIKLIKENPQVYHSIHHHHHPTYTMQTQPPQSLLSMKPAQKKHILNAFINILNSKKSQKEIVKDKMDKNVMDKDQYKSRLYQQQTNVQANQQSEKVHQKPQIKKVAQKTFKDQKIYIQLPFPLIEFGKVNKRDRKKGQIKVPYKKKEEVKAKDVDYNPMLSYEEDNNASSAEQNERPQKKSKLLKKEAKKNKKMGKAQKKMQYKECLLNDELQQQQLTIEVQESQLQQQSEIILIKPCRDFIYIEQYEESQQNHQEIDRIMSKVNQFTEYDIEIVIQQDQIFKRQIQQKQSKKNKRQRNTKILYIESCQDQHIEKPAKYEEVNFIIQIIQDTSLAKQVQKKKKLKKGDTNMAKKAIIHIQDVPEETLEMLRDPTKPWRLGNVPLQDLVKELSLKNIIKQQLHQDFIKANSNSYAQDFITKFRTGKLHHFNYRQIKFTLLDHRRITELLLSLYPQQYFLGEIYDIDNESNKFLQSLYELSAQAYYNLFNKVDRISNTRWWSKILITHEDKLTVNHKEKIMAKRKAEQASEAVEQMLKSFLHKEHQKERQRTKRHIYSIDLDDDEEKANIENSKRENERKKEKERIENRQKQMSQLNKIRTMVSNFSKGQVALTQPETTKKIKFY